MTPLPRRRFMFGRHKVAATLLRAVFAVSSLCLVSPPSRMGRGWKSTFSELALAFESLAQLRGEGFYTTVRHNRNCE